MATAGEVAYGGQIGSGEAQVFQERLHPMLQFSAAQERAQANNELARARLRQQQQQKRNADVQKYIDDNVGTPGWFQQEQSVNELNQFRSKGLDYAMQNQDADVNSVRSHTQDERASVSRRIAKRQEIQKEIELLRQDRNNSRSLMDSQWVDTQANKAFDADVDQIGRGEIMGLKNHPRAYDADKGIIKAVDDVKNQVNYTGVGGPQDIGFGIQIDGWTKKTRFKTDASGRIANETVNFVLDSDPSISQRIRWDIARQQAGVQDDAYASPEEMNKIAKAYEAIRFSDDPSIVSQVRGKVRQTLDALQQSQYIDRMKIQNKPGGAGQVTPDDINDRRAKIETITGAFGTDYSQDTPSTNALKYLGELQGVAKFNGLPVSKIELKSAPLSTKGPSRYSGPAKLIIKLKTGVNEDLFNSTVEEFGVKKISNDIVEVDLNSPEAQRVLNNLWNSTNPVTKEKKIPASDLFGGAKVNLYGLPEDEEEDKF